jgi:DNA-binding MarR family transcriptional regulator
MMIEAGNAENFLSVMYNLSNAMKSESEHCCKVCGGLNEKELFIIHFIGENKSVKMSAIADNIQAPLSTLTTIVDKLVTNKFLLRYNSNDDRRVVKVELKNQKEIMAKKVLSQLSEAEQLTLIANLTHLVSSIQS